MSPFLNTYNRVPVRLVRGQGSRVQDDQGRWYLDATSGIAVQALGHSHPAILAAVHAQVDQLMHCSNLFGIPVQEKLAERLSELFDGAVFLTNSGSEAVETALKIVRKHHQGTGRTQILVAEHAFHGRTLGALSLTPKAKYQAPFHPLMPDVVAVPPEQLAASVTSQTAAVFVEPVRGEGGCLPTPDLQGIRDACTRHGALLVYDEIQCGLGRAGVIGFAPQPDVRTLAKALGGGLPLGAAIASGPVRDIFSPGDHGSTFGGNPVACAAGSAFLDVLIAQDLAGRCAREGALLRGKLEDGGVRVTGQGLMLAVHLEQPSGPVLSRMREAGVLACGAGALAVRLLPPYTATRTELGTMAEAVLSAR